MYVYIDRRGYDRDLETSFYVVSNCKKFNCDLKNEIEDIKHDCVNVNTNTIDNDDDATLQYKHYLFSNICNSLL